MRGLELPINLIIVLVLCLIVLIAFIYIVYSTSTNTTQSIGLTGAKNNACQMLINLGCTMPAASIITNNFDANKDFTVDGSDTLLELCINYYNIDDDTECKTSICNCPST